MVSASFWTTKSCKTEKCEKAASARSMFAEKLRLFVIPANRPQKLFMVSVSFLDDKIVQKPEFARKKPTEGIVKNIAKFRVGKV